MLERGLVLDAMHHVVCVDEKPRKLARPIVGELVGHATVHGLHFVAKLVVVVLLQVLGSKLIVIQSFGRVGPNKFSATSKSLHFCNLLWYKQR